VETFPLASAQFLGMLDGRREPMFLRQYTRKKAGKVHRYWALVESMRTEDGPRQRVVAHLGELNHREQRRWQRTLVFYNRHGDVEQLRLFPDDPSLCLPDEPDIVRVRLSSAGWTTARSFGDVWLGLWLWRLLKLDEILDRHLPAGRHTVRPSDVVAIEAINRLCAPSSEFALAEHWYASTGLEDLLGIPDGEITKDRLYRTLDALRQAKEKIENDLKVELGTLFALKYDVLLYDLTSSYFEGLAEENPLAKRGYSRDHRGDCKQIVLALVVTREGFPLAHYTLAGSTQDVETVQKIVTAVESRFGKSQRVWVMDRGMMSEENLKFLSQSGRHYLIGTRRSELANFREELSIEGWTALREEVEVKPVERDGVAFLLARSSQRKKKERAIRKRQLLGLQRGLKRLGDRVRKGRLRERDKVVEQVGRLKERFPQAARLATIAIAKRGTPQVAWKWRTDAIRAALIQDGAYLLKSNFHGWSPEEFWETYMQLTVAEKAFRTLKSELLIRPIWHHYDGRVEAHVMVCVLAYALWKTLDHLAKQAGLMTLIHKPDLARRPATAQPRPMSPEVILRELAKIQIGDILLETVDGRQLALRRVARPMPEQARILAALKLNLPERLSPDRLL
jgi:transposase